MSSNFLVVKGRHQGYDDLLKTKPYIWNADVVSDESAYASESHVSFLEVRHMNLLSDPIAQQEIWRSRSSEYFFDYTRASLDMILKNEKPLIFFERFPNEEAHEKQKQGTRLLDTTDEGLVAPVLVGDFGGAMRNLWNLVQEEKTIVAERDANIVQNVQTGRVYDRLYELYPQFKIKRVKYGKDIKFVIILGYLHRSEIALATLPDIAVEVVNLYAPQTYWEKLQYHVIMQDKSYEYSKNIMARMLLQLTVQRAFACATPYSLLSEDYFDQGIVSKYLVRDLGIQELSHLTTKITSTHEGQLFLAVQEFFTSLNRPLPRGTMNDYRPLKWEAVQFYHLQ